MLGRIKFGTFEVNGLISQIEQYEPLKFKYHNHEADMACSLIYHDQFYVIAGFDQPNG